jgi:hypothetical protein
VRLYVAFLVAAIALISGLASASDNLVGFNSQIGQLVEIDTTTCGTTPIVENPPIISAGDAFAIDDSGIFYFTKNLGGIGETLLKWDIRSNLILIVGQSIGFGRVNGMAISPDGDLVATDGNTNQLLIIDTTTGVGRAIGSIPVDLQGIAFRDDGALFGVQFRSPGRVYAIDPASAVSEFIGDSGFAGFDNLGFAAGRFFAVDGFLDALVEIDIETGEGTLIPQCSTTVHGDLDNLPDSLLRAPDTDGDGIRDSFDNCPRDANMDQSDSDGDLIGDVCDPFPNDSDNEQAQCEADLAACEAVRAFVDSDGDGEDDSTDACPGTVVSAVDTAGCSLAQFCSSIDTSTKVGERACRSSDWLNDEAITAPKDCALQKQGRGQPPLCVPG